MSLRYDLTAPLARYVAQNYDSLPKPYRSYRQGWVFRNEKPGPGRFRQFMQFDADTVGSGSPAADAEICMMAADTMEALGIPRGSYVVKVNNRKVLDGVLEAIGLGGDENAGRRLTVLRAIDKLDKFGPEGVRLLLGAGRKDESGDFTKGAGLDEARTALVLDAIAGNTAQAEKAAGGMMSEGLSELASMDALFRSAGYGPDRIRIDPSVVRGLEYYTGPVYEVELTFEVSGDDGKPVRFGSVAGGGRYDGLVARFRGEDVPATGFSIGVSRLLAALMHLKKIDVDAETGPVVVTVMDKDRVADYQRMTAALRADGIRAEMYLGSAGFKAQMKYADRRHAPCVVIQGSDEKIRGEIQIKDLVLGAELASADRNRDDYKEKQAQAQVAVPESALVETVRLILTRQRGG
jgi:histidyl-tRNA synthetase